MTYPRTAWIITDGKQGHLAPMLAVAETLGIRYEIKMVQTISVVERLALSLRSLRRVRHRDLARFNLVPPYPDLCMASGRRTIPFLHGVKRAEPDLFCVYLMNPRTHRCGADLIVAQRHDGLTGAGILQVTIAPHRFSEARLDQCRRNPNMRLIALPQPRIAVLVGGDSRHHRFSRKDIKVFASALEELAATGAGLMMTTSRRTPAPLVEAVSDLASRTGAYLWDGLGENPLADILALADETVVTSDSVNMIGEATATGRPIHIFSPSGGHPKFKRFLDTLSEVATIGPFPGPMGGASYPPIDSTSFVAEAIRKRYAHRHVAVPAQAKAYRDLSDSHSTL